MNIVKILHSVLVVLLLVTVPLFGQRGDRSERDRAEVRPEWDIPPAPVLTPEEALESFVLQPGFRIELVASEPLLHDPVAIDFDEDGRIWVVEMRSYMPDVDGQGELEPVSRVVVLEDTTGDGKMDRSTVYMDNLTLPRSIQVVEGGVLIAEPPYVWFTRDTTGDLRADEKIAVVDNYSRRGANPEHAANGLVRGIDNWLHSAMYNARLRLIDGEWVSEPAVGRGQWGISHDNYGRHYTNPNAYYLHVDHVPNHYYPRNNHLSGSNGVYSRTDSDRSVFPIRITPGVNRLWDLDADANLITFTATCSPLAYRGDQFPAEYVGDVFVAEPAGNLIRRAVLSEDENGVLRSRNAYDEEEFLASYDERFRPVYISNGPDGALYIVDMYRGIIQHRQFVTTYLRRQIIDRELEQPLGLGRIYRVVHDSSEPEPAPRMSEMTSADLVTELAHPNGWRRDTAQRLLVEARDSSVIPALKEMAAGHESELARIHALWTLEGLSALDESILIPQMDHPHREVRVAALRVAEAILRESPGEELGAEAVRLTFDEDPRVRLHAALALGELPASEFKEEALADVLRRHASQPFLREAVLSGLNGRELDLLQLIASSPDWTDQSRGNREVFQMFAAAVMAERDPARMDRLFSFVADVDRAPWQALAVLEGIRTSRVTRMDFRPAAIDLSPPNEEVARRAAEVYGEMRFPEEGAGDAGEVLTPEIEELLARGAERYEMNCAACHHSTGQGIEGLSAPLIDSEWVVGQPRNLVRIVLHGKDGEEALMPPMGASLSDEDVAAILSYLRMSWGHSESPVHPDQVTAVRQGTTRNSPWTAEELSDLVE